MDIKRKGKISNGKMISIISNSPYIKFLLMIILIILLANITFDLGRYASKFIYMLLH